MPWSILGAERATAALSSMILNGRLPHALLFTGPRGCGKNFLARELARAVNCLDPAADGGPCHKCRACLKVDKDIHPDLATIEPVGRMNQIRIQDVRDLRAAMAFRPYEGKAKVFIIRRADRLAADGGNALLKTLEEPPPDSILILTSASEADLMPTILSRCLRLKIPPLPESLILAALAERRDLVGPKAALLAAFCGGALGPALEQDPDELWEAWESLDSFMELPGARRLDAALAWSKEHGADESKLPTLTALLRLWWRETFLTAAAGGGARAEGLPPSPARRAWAARLNGMAIETVNQAHEALADSIKRLINTELALSNYWLAVLSSV